MTNSIRPVAIVGSTRIPFCRSNSAYADLTNLDMLTTVMKGIVYKYQLQNEQLGEVNAGSVIHHSKDWNLAREAVLGSGLSPLTPATTLQQACGTSLQALMIAAAKIACGQIDSAIAAGSDTTSDVPIVFGKKISKRFVKLSKARSVGAKLGVFKGFGFSELAPVVPSVNEPRTLLSMGQHAELMAKEWGIGREDQDLLALASHQKAAAAYEAGFFDDLLTPCAGVMRDNNLRADSTLEKMASLRTAYDRTDAGTLTAANSTPLTDGAAGVLLASEEWARERGLPILAYLTASRTEAVDFVSGEGLLIAPASGVSQMLRKAGLKLQDFDFYEIHEAFAAQVLCTLKAWESEQYCTERLGLTEAMGSIDPAKLNVKGSSLAVGHPFAATGARIAGMLAKILDENEGGRGLISVCTAGGMGVTAILEK